MWEESRLTQELYSSVNTYIKSMIGVFHFEAVLLPSFVWVLQNLEPVRGINVILDNILSLLKTETKGVGGLCSSLLVVFVVFVAVVV